MNIKLIFFSLVIVFLIGCNTPSDDKIKNLVSGFIKKNAKDKDSYKPIFFSEIDTTFYEIYEDALLRHYKPDNKYAIEHVYEIKNSANEKVIMSVNFSFDSLLNLIKVSPEGINGDYGQFSGNVYWKYNNYVGDKPDAGSDILLQAIDTLRQHLKYQAVCDVTGNFKIEAVLPGWYLMVTRSHNTTSAPIDLLDELVYYSDYLNKIYGYDIAASNISKLEEMKTLDSIYSGIFDDYDVLHNDLYKGLKAREKINQQKNDIASGIIKNLPSEFASKLQVYGLYNRKIELALIKIDEGKTTNKIIDFGITYY